MCVRERERERERGYGDRGREQGGRMRERMEIVVGRTQGHREEGGGW